jgi:N-acetyl-gamma-glutamyl-phosphate reductase
VAYEGKPFVSVLESGLTPDSKWVCQTNRVDFSATYDPRTENLIITSAEDNLMKGAAGQAIQIMNLWNGFDETAGLV